MAEHDLILHNGQVSTLDGESRTAEAVAVTGGRITAVGDSKDLLRDAGRYTRTLDLDGRTACPGFIDTHAHMDREGLKARCGFGVTGSVRCSPPRPGSAEFIADHTHSGAGTWMMCS